MACSRTGPVGNCWTQAVAAAESRSAQPVTALVRAQLREVPGGNASAYAIAACGSSSAQRETKSETSMLFSCGFGNVCTKARTSRTLLASTVSESLLKVAYVWGLAEWVSALLIFSMISAEEAASAGSFLEESAVGMGSLPAVDVSDRPLVASEECGISVLALGEMEVC